VKIVIRLLRKLVAMLLCFVAVLVAFIGFVIGVGKIGGVDKVIQNSREIENSFDKANAYIESFRKDHGRLPKWAEFDAWKKTQPDSLYGVRSITLLGVPGVVHVSEGSACRYPPEAIKIFGPAPADSYLLDYWRGESSEYFASWAGKNTLIWDHGPYFVTGNSWLDTAAATGIAAMLIFCAVKLWPKGGARPAIPSPAL
jgi:hypothetical protein